MADLHSQQFAGESEQNASTEQTVSLYWHALSVDEVFARQQCSSAGLDTAEAASRLLRYGSNRLPEPPQRSLLQRFLLQFHNLLIYVLLGAGVMTALLADWVDAGVILLVVVINAQIGGFSGRKDRKSGRFHPQYSHP